MGIADVLGRPGEWREGDIEVIETEMAQLAEIDLGYPFLLFAKSLLDSGIGDEAIDKVMDAIRERIRMYHDNEGI